MLRQFRIAAASIAVLAALLSSAGCGIKGPLVLPPAKAGAGRRAGRARTRDDDASGARTIAATLPAEGNAPTGERKP